MNAAHSTLRIGTAGWTVPKQHLHLVPPTGAEEARSHLQRYASMLNCTEVNSSFHRPHLRNTWARWAASTPESFLFAVKLPKAITHTGRLMNAGASLARFFGEVAGLGKKLGPVLVQLPPKLAFDEGVAHEFLSTLRELHAGDVVLEPRHMSWFVAAADRLLRSFAVARVAADPPKAPRWPRSPVVGQSCVTGVCMARLAPTTASTVSRPSVRSRQHSQRKSKPRADAPGSSLITPRSVTQRRTHCN